MIGAGFNANFHRRALTSVRGGEISAVYALKGAPEFAEASAADGLGTPRVCASIAELCNNSDVVGIFIPNFARIDTMQAIVDAVAGGAKLTGLVCEKPLARNIREANEMVALADKAGLNTAYFENQIFMPGLVSAKAQLAAVETAMGSVHLARSAEEHGGPHEPWFWDPTKQGGGVYCDMGCHSAAVGMYMCTPSGKAPDFLQFETCTASMSLLKWGNEPWKSALKARGVDYDKTPAEDYAVANYTFRNPETGQRVAVQATDSWMYDAPGLRLLMEAFAPGYSYTIDTLKSPNGVFIGDQAAASVADAEMVLEKSQASSGALILQANEPDLYGYCGEWRDALAAFASGWDGLLSLRYGALVTQLVMAAYWSAENNRTFVNGETDLSDYIPLIQQGRGAAVLG
jgi:predicted dehydrogenase